MPDEKDRLGDQLHQREKAEEDRYFSELSKKQLEKLRERHAKAAAEGFARCPRCGEKMSVVQRADVAVETCPSEHGVWLDRKEIEDITKREGSNHWVARLLLGKKA
ncbi:MAG TPA: zf-TFIIB domain-containing protein [Candidatus Eisenbacteria bacterium]|nr:zf-TFIIB domain-containing protein [Candidatus Eisenbacteria bacterium]